MKIHLAWIRVTAAAAIAAGVGVYPAAAQYAPYRPAPAQSASPQPAAAAPATPYVAYQTQPAYPQTPSARYQAPVTPVAPYQSPAAAFNRQPVAYPQTAMAQYPAVYGGTPYVAQTQPTEAIPAPQDAAPAQEATPAADQGAPNAAAPSTAAPSGYPAAGCNCGTGGYSAGQYYGAGGAGCGCNGSYPDVSGYMDDCGNDIIWFGGVYFLYMDRDEPSPVRLAVEVDSGAVAYPYYPPKSTTVVSTENNGYDFRPGVEVRFGSTFHIGDGCNNCNSYGSGYGYTGCNSCARPTTYAWEFGWWGIDNDAQSYVFQDQVTTRVYSNKSFSGLQYDRDGAGGAYAYRPVNDYYDYQMPVQTPPARRRMVTPRCWPNVCGPTSRFRTWN